VGAPSPLLQVRRLRTFFYFRDSCVRAVDGADLDVPEGTVVGIVGESGCGKSTTAHSIIRLLPLRARIVEGSIVFGGRDLVALAPDEMRGVRGRHIAMIFQDPLTYLNPTLRVGEQIAEKIRTHLGLPEPRIREMVAALLDEVGLPAGAEALYPHEMSGGMGQRALIATAMACEPSLIIADEPTSALDVTTQAQILELFKRLREAHRTAFLLITHDLGVAAEVCDWVYVMYAGEIVESGSVYDVLERPAHPYTQGLLASALSIDEFRETLSVLEGNPPDLGAPPTGCRFHPRCPYAMAVCSQEAPPVTEVEPDHGAACWLKVE
jgi:oligopeptide/dipeptide ABC transporter ATP-binding protein